MSIGIIVSRHYPEITNRLLESTLTRLHEKGINQDNIHLIYVPAASEIPFTAAALASQKKFSIIICLGSIIRGETNHYDVICQQVSFGIQRVMLDHQIPIISGLLTTDNIIQAEDRIDGTRSQKGVEVADAALMMIDVVNQLKKITAEAS